MKRIEERPQKESRFSISIINPIRRQIFNDKGILFSWRVEKKGSKYPSFLPSRFKLKIYRLDDKGRLKEKKPVVEKIVTGHNIRFDDEIIPRPKGNFFGIAVEALGASGEILAESPLRRFGRYSHPAPEYSLVRTDTKVPKLGDFLPHSPLVWGRPVTLRHPSFYTPIPVEHDDTPPDGGPGGTVQPMVWGGPAAYLELPAEFIANCNLRWHYDHIDGCYAVALQIAGGKGFAYQPGEDENHLEDPNAAATFWGPVTTCLDEPESNLLYYDFPSDPDQEVFGYLPWLDLFDEEIWGEAVDVNEPLSIHLRLIPVGSDGEPLGDVSPHTLVYYSGAINYVGFFEDPAADYALSTRWRWDAVPERQIDFYIWVPNSGFDAQSAPSTLLITTDTGDPLPDDWEDHSQLFLRSLTSGRWEPITETTIATSGYSNGRMGCYVVDIEWRREYGYEFRLIESWPRHPGASHGIPLPHLTPTVSVFAYPGIVSDEAFCSGPFTRESIVLPDVPIIDRGVCVYNQLQFSSESFLDFSGWDELYLFFTGTFTGHRIAVTRRVERSALSSDVSDILDWESWEEEESTESSEDTLVTIDFNISGAPHDGEDLMQLMARTGYVLMECIERGVDLADYSMTYTFEWRGLWGTLTEEDGALRHFGGLHGPFGTVILGLPSRLEMDFSVELDRSSIMEGDFVVGEVKRYLDLSYRLDRD